MPDAQTKQKLVAAYVISDDMAERDFQAHGLQLISDDSVDHKTCSSSATTVRVSRTLMSVLSLVAEDAGYAPMIRHTRLPRRFANCWSLQGAAYRTLGCRCRCAKSSPCSLSDSGKAWRQLHIPDR